jgi:hypothetical protein
MEKYEDSVAKIALSLTATQMAKDMLVQSEGIGEDLSFNFFSWIDDRPQMCVQMTKKYMDENPGERFKRCTSLARILRSQFESQAITFIAEGYVSKQPQQKALSLAFLDESSGVKECLTVIHCEKYEDEQLPEMFMFTVPYKYEVPRSVRWGEMMAFSRNGANLFQSFSYPTMIFETMQIDVESIDERHQAGLIELISKNGFQVQRF